MVKLSDAMGLPQLTPEAAKKEVKIDHTFCERRMEECGFLRSIAGDSEFHRAMMAFYRCMALDRGILVTGKNGCGKTKYLRAIFNLMQTKRKWFSCGNSDEVDALEYPIYDDTSIFIDDLGAERFKYGDVDIVGEFISRWYENHEPRKLLFVSTNLTGAEIDRRYGGRIFDRLRELCIIFPMLGGSKRMEEIIPTEAKDWEAQ